MSKLVQVSLVVLMSVLTGNAAAQQGHMSKYAGQEDREIKSLSPEDLKELRNGGGWGLAKAAELNGMPGPSHLLKMKNEVELSADQVERISKLFETMKAKAISQGAELIALEKQLEEVFRNKTVTDAHLRLTLSRIADVRKELRYIHLSTHLQTPKILSAKQIAKYNSLRGYNKEPCAAVPKGHDVKMWRKHNGCG